MPDLISTERSHHLQALCSLACFLVFAGSFSLPAAAQFEQAEELLSTQAAREFKAGNYQEAVSGFRQLSEQYPENVTILRYLAISLSKAGAFVDAIEVFRILLQKVPNNAAVSFHLGVTLYKANQTDEAEHWFLSVLKIAQQSRYAEVAREYLDAISAQQRLVQRPGEPQKWGVYAQLGMQLNNNVPSAPDGAFFTGEREDTNLSGYLSGTYYLLRTSDWLAAIDITGYRDTYTKDEFDGFDVFHYTAGASIQRTAQTGTFPSVYSARYDFQGVQLDDDDYSATNLLTFGIRLGFTDNTSSYFSYQYSDDDFDYEGFDSFYSSRDADKHTIAAVNTWYFSERMFEFELGASYFDNQADGLNFRYDGWGVNSAFHANLPENWRTSFEAKYRSENYPDFAAPQKRDDEILDLSLSAIKWFGSNFYIQGFLDYTETTSSYEVLEYDRTSIGLRITYVY